MSNLNFQSEHPALEDVFPGGSHDKVATAISDYLLGADNSQVIGLDGEFGSGKSSILKMVEQKLEKGNPNYKVWFFDCEQNYQGSIKSNFIELFTEELLSSVGSNKATREVLTSSRDKALGRHYTYTKNTISRVSVWALLLIVALFFCSSSFKELFTLSRSTTPVPLWLYFLHGFSLLSPGLILGAAYLKLKDTEVNGEPWSIWHLFKGGTDDTVTEKIRISKDVTPLDLKRTLTSQLSLLGDRHYVVVLDNLDRLPKDSLRAVWSDLEIFTWASEAKNLTVIVPFCSNKVAKYLGSDQDGTYDSRDFIAKKFPIVFRSPPVIASGWKTGFQKLWESTYPAEHHALADKCAQLLQRHSPMMGRLVTPRLQKRFINDIATASLILGDSANLVCIAAHLLLCKYTEHPLAEVIRVGGLSEIYGKNFEDGELKDLAATQQLLTDTVGTNMHTGWQIQFLQIHFLTSSDIAIAELIDEPLAEAIASDDAEKFKSLVSMFGFWDAFKRYVAKNQLSKHLILTIQLVGELLENSELVKVMAIVNSEAKNYEGDGGSNQDAFYDALEYCRESGLRVSLFDGLKDKLETEVFSVLNEPVTVASIPSRKAELMEYDRCLAALGQDVGQVDVDSAEYLFHIVIPSADLKVIAGSDFTLSKSARTSAVRQIASSTEEPLSFIPLEPDHRLLALNFLCENRRLDGDIVEGLSAVDVDSLMTAFSINPNNEGVLIGLALASKKIDPAQVAIIAAQTFEGRTMIGDAAIAAIFLRANDFANLAKVENLSQVSNTETFRLLLRACVTSGSLISGLTNASVAKEIAGIFAWCIQERAIHRLNTDWVAQNFSLLTNLTRQFDVDEVDVLNWFGAWEVHIKYELDQIALMDIALINLILENQSELYSNFVKKAVDFFTAKDRSEADWSKVLLGDSPNCSAVLNYLSEKECRLESSLAAKNSILNLLSGVVTDAESSSLTGNVIRNIRSLLNVIEQSIKNALGTDLRTLMYSDAALPERNTEMLGEFGALIVELQPADPREVGRLMTLLGYLARHVAVSTSTIQYLDSRAEQITAYRYSQELKHAMAIAVAELANEAPKLYKAFAKKRGVGAILKSLLSGPDSESAPTPSADSKNAASSDS
ncbi:P-loop NTPase fold protein [Pseudomonas umsongensis]|uniref:P-loop NTPase fold protein n=1 Tax=Pseudomonas umsongensis TaxID=198618 RepID=UPI0003687297|nr:P-loop NTPase fold protein [Pseudomonas umsongensis]